MKLLSPLLCAALFAGLTATGSAANTTGAAKPSTPIKKSNAPATNAAPEAPAPPPAAEPAPAAPASAVPTLKFEDYIVEVTTAANLNDREKKEIEDLYVADGAQMKTILNDNALSPYQKAQKVADLRADRNKKIGTLLVDVGRNHVFLLVEAKYRVALTDLAADGGLVAATPPPAPAK